MYFGDLYKLVEKHCAATTGLRYQVEFLKVPLKHTELKRWTVMEMRCWKKKIVIIIIIVFTIVWEWLSLDR